MPISRLKIFEKWPECSTIRPMPCVDPLGDAVDDRVVDRAVGLVAPPEEDVGVVEAIHGEAVLGLVEGGGRGVDALVGGERGGDGAVDAVGVDGADERVLALVDELVPDDGSDHGGPPEGGFGGEWRGSGGGARGVPGHGAGTRTQIGSGRRR